MQLLENKNKYKNPRFPPKKINDCKIKLYFSSFDAIIKKSKPNWIRKKYEICNTCMNVW